jgi:hypothetical protein
VLERPLILNERRKVARENVCMFVQPTNWRLFEVGGLLVLH